MKPEARGICHICHMVNPALLRKHVLDTVPDHPWKEALLRVILSQTCLLSISSTLFRRRQKRRGRPVVTCLQP